MYFISWHLYWPGLYIRFQTHTHTHIHTHCHTAFVLIHTLHALFFQCNMKGSCFLKSFRHQRFLFSSCWSTSKLSSWPNLQSFLKLFHVAHASEFSIHLNESFIGRHSASNWEDTWKHTVEKSWPQHRFLFSYLVDSMSAFDLNLTNQIKIVTYEPHKILSNFVLLWKKVW